MNKATSLAGDTNTARDTYKAYHVRSRNRQQSARATEHSRTIVLMTRWTKLEVEKSSW